MKLVEVTAIADVFASGLARVDIISGGFARFILYSERQTEDGPPIYVVAARIVMPLSAVPDAILQTTRAIQIAALGQGEPLYN